MARRQKHLGIQTPENRRTPAFTDPENL